MRVMPGRDPQHESRRAPEQWFTGTVWQEPVFDDPEEASVKALWVVFAPGGRTHWHRHGESQLLYVTAGQGRVANRGGAASEIRTGDLVHIPPGEEHWHGAGPSTLMIHLAVTIGQTDWLEEVTELDFSRRL